MRISDWSSDVCSSDLYTDEGADLRESGIKMPIMVMSPEPLSFETLSGANLEPEIYSFRILEEFLRFLEGKGIDNYPVHIKLDTGMHRLGFMEEDIRSE